MDRDRLEKQLSFILEIDKEKNILRQTHLSGQGRRENDAEHAWHMALAAVLLQEYANEKVDIGRVVLMCLLHDIAEIDAGDAYAYDEQAQKTQAQREAAARERIFSLLPEDQKRQLTDILEEFEASETPEARFARAMDNVQPFLLNDSNDGSDWLEHDVCFEQVCKRHARTARGAAPLYDWTRERLEYHLKAGHLKKSGEKE